MPLRLSPTCPQHSQYLRLPLQEGEVQRLLNPTLLRDCDNHHRICDLYGNHTYQGFLSNRLANCCLWWHISELEFGHLSSMHDDESVLPAVPTILFEEGLGEFQLNQATLYSTGSH